MSNRIRTELYRKIGKIGCSENLNKVISYVELKLDDSTGDFYFSLPVKTKEYDMRKLSENIKALKGEDNFVKSIETRKEKLGENFIFRLNKEMAMKNIVENDPRDILISNANENNNNNDNFEQKKIIVEYSSPNIAKPFHVGHLRSTIIGNYIANINHFLSNDVRRINYLGDWGTQFGFVQLGINLLNVSDDTIKKDAVKVLYDAYVHANKLAETDPSISEKARRIFNDLEAGEISDEGFRKWEIFREFTVEELKQTYKRLGVNFDEYNWESSYNFKRISKVIEIMESQGLLVLDDEKRRVIPLNEKRNIPIIKSDGSTLYITRDIAAAIDRYDKHKFDLMYYVVDNAQTDHFNNLNIMLNKMRFPWADNIRHVKFGRIRNMSTRKGTAVFLKDILDETQFVMRENQIRSPNTKVLLNSDDESTDILGISAVIVNDLKQRRLRDYEFDWNKALDVKGDTGVKLQYVHCRLTSLEENCGKSLPKECDPSLLKDPIIAQLVVEIGRFDQAVIKSHRELEPCVLVNYLFGLSHVINKGLKLIRVKGEPEDVGSQRLLVFHAAKNVLAQGMKILGLQPLNKM